MKKTKLFLTLFLFTVLLAVPSLASAATYHTVQPGDTLWKISRTFGVAVERIRELNSLDSSLIFPGQRILVAEDRQVRREAPQDSGSGRPETVSRGTGRVEKILDYAGTFTGVPYIFGGETPKGFDCSGYIQYVFGHFGIKLPRTASEQFSIGRRVTEQEARPGDMVAFMDGGEISHTGIYLGGGKFISATSSRGVMVANVHGHYWAEHLYGFSRIIP